MVRHARIKKPSDRLGCGILTLFGEGFVGQLHLDHSAPKRIARSAGDFNLVLALWVFQVAEEIAFRIDHHQILLAAKGLTISV